MPDVPKPGSPPPPTIFTYILILAIGIIIGVLIGWLVISEEVNIHKGDPAISSYDTQTGLITLPVASNHHYWVTSMLPVDVNKGLDISPVPGAGYVPHHNCTGGPLSFWSIPADVSHQLSPRYENSACSGTSTLPATQIIVPTTHMLATKTGTIGMTDPGGMPVTYPIDIYTFTDANGKTSCITIIMVNY